MNILDVLVKNKDKDIKDLGNGFFRVKWDYLNANFMSLMDEDLFWSYTGHDKYIEIAKSKFDEMVKRKTEKDEKDRMLNLCAERNNQGIRYEKQGSIEEAIKIYEENINPECYPARHSFDRLLVLYRKRKDYQNEQRVCKRAISVFKKEQKYKDRLVKIENLISKSK